MFSQMFVVLIRSWIWKAVSVCADRRFDIMTVAQIDVLTPTPASVCVTSPQQLFALPITASTKRAVGVCAAGRVRSTSHSTRQSVPVNVMSHQISVSSKEGGFIQQHAAVSELHVRSAGGGVTLGFSLVGRSVVAYPLIGDHWTNSALGSYE